MKRYPVDSEERYNRNASFPGYAAIEEMLPAYVLGALEASEMLMVDDYIHQHQSLLRQLERLEETMGQLAFVAPQIAPPPRAKSQLMARIHQDQAEQQSVAAARPVTTPQPLLPATPAMRPIPASKAAPADDWLASLRRWFGNNLIWPGLTAVTATAALLMVIYIGQTGGRMNVLTGRLDQMQQELSALQLQNEQLEAVNDDLQQRMFERENQLALFSTATQVVALEGTEESPGASGVFYAGRDANVLVLHDLQPLPAGQIYELWLIPEEGAPVPAGLVQVDEDGHAAATLAAADLAVNYAAIGVSIEPESGSQQPTGPIVLLGTVKG